MTGHRLTILYLVHDLSDTAVTKRVAMLKDGGADMTIMGFHRTATTPDTIHGCPVIPLGQTYDGKFLHRIITTLRTVLSIHKHKSLFVRSDVIIARTLEMLSVAVRGRSLSQDKKPTLVYESLDIHRLLLGNKLPHRMLRALEGWLAKSASLVLTSSPAFIHDYFEKISQVKCPMLLIENKVYEPDLKNTLYIERPTAPPWRIGWFGAIRCAKSLKILSGLVRDMQGQVEVIIRGRPSLDQFDDFYKDVSGIDGLRFEGPYKNPDDLERIYSEVHFTWAIDMFEEGLNSSWLLPNRIYEGGRYGSIPIAQNHVETGRKLATIGTGVLLKNPLPEDLHAFFRNLTIETYRTLETQARSIPVTTWVATRTDSINLVDTLAALGKKNS